jgi:hypothetical protein
MASNRTLHRSWTKEPVFHDHETYGDFPKPLPRPRSADQTGPPFANNSMVAG